jgi:type IV pilus assembly protein PilV
MNNNRFHKSRAVKAQRGVMLIEGLIAILIFSLGVLAMVGLQAASINHSSQAKYRIDASFVANKLISQMWVDTNANMNAYATGGAKFTTWKTQELEAYLPPGRSNATVTVTPFAATQQLIPGAPPVTGYNVVVTIQWRGPNEADSVAAHSYQVEAQIVRN